MNYEINVSKNGVHFFATAERSLTAKSIAKLAYDKLKEAFPESEGYKLTISRWETVGKEVKPSELETAQ
ncbi:MAG: hypothetical protein ACXADH_12715 [Candidatus Kariarchaeaceae archaeon]|jgi:hypothetical protein